VVARAAAVENCIMLLATTVLEPKSVLQSAAAAAAAAFVLAGTLDGIIDTVSAKHDITALTSLLAPRGRLVMVGLPPQQPTLNHFDMILRCVQVSCCYVYMINCYISVIG
jgi:D-arabinose 1-dehydrogenase-like Zn-dependent alcohol dehydrogenase